MYDANKNVIITIALYNQLLQVASASENIQVDTQSDNNVSFTHSVEKLGQQILLFTMLGNGLVMVTFIGDEEYLAQLEIEGWLESAEQLAAYFVGLGDDFRPILAKAKKTEIGPNYTVLMWDEETLDVVTAQDVLLNHPESGDPQAAISQLVDNAAEAIVETVGPAIDKAAEIVEEVREDANQNLKDARENLTQGYDDLMGDVRTEVESIMERARWRRILSSPVTKVIAGAAVIGAGALIWRAVRAKAESVVPELADVQL